jgi:hypothetical protein
MAEGGVQGAFRLVLQRLSGVTTHELRTSIDRLVDSGQGIFRKGKRFAMKRKDWAFRGQSHPLQN